MGNTITFIREKYPSLDSAVLFRYSVGMTFHLSLSNLLTKSEGLLSLVKMRINPF